MALGLELDAPITPIFIGTCITFTYLHANISESPCLSLAVNGKIFGVIVEAHGLNRLQA